MEHGELAPHQEMEWFGNRVREGRYTLSEHVVRNLAEGKISVQGIETILTTGRVLEERRNPKRLTSYLVYGEYGGRPLHVVCAEDTEHRMVVLFAYQPTLPVWASPTRRNDHGESRMAGSVGTCFFCGGTLIEITIGNYFYRYQGQMCIVKRLPATLCEQCGEKYIGAETGRTLNVLIEEKRFSGTEEASVIEFQPEEDVP